MHNYAYQYPEYLSMIIYIYVYTYILYDTYIYIHVFNTSDIMCLLISYFVLSYPNSVERQS